MPIVATAAATAVLGLAAPTASATVSAAPIPLPRYVSEDGVTGAGHHRAVTVPAGHPAPIDRYRLGDHGDSADAGQARQAGQAGQAGQVGADGQGEAVHLDRGVLGFLYGLDDHRENSGRGANGGRGENSGRGGHSAHGGHGGYSRQGKHGGAAKNSSTVKHGGSGKHSGVGTHSSPGGPGGPGGRGSRGAQGSPVPPDVPAWTGVASDSRLPFHHDVLVPHAPVDHLTVTVHHSGSASTNGTFELYCHPSSGSTHRDPKGACAKLDRMTKWGKDPFAPAPQSAQCTMIYGGPATAQVTGTWAGRRVNAQFKRTNGCEVSRWNDFEPLLPATTGSNPVP
ncbi:SSI family serine proteinase inhibitor [Streptomyces sp. NPDC001339]|uniref:SSI family serine proteinase inhibitor n=1 Tax=Streptomyces sp. NPDC001339 TaxID=3364563 RepID=UPI0036811140